MHSYDLVFITAFVVYFLLLTWHCVSPMFKALFLLLIAISLVSEITVSPEAEMKMLTMVLYATVFSLMVFLCNNRFQQWWAAKTAFGRKATNRSWRNILQNMREAKHPADIYVCQTIVFAALASMGIFAAMNIRLVFVLGIMLVLSLLLSYFLKGQRKYLAPFLAFVIADFTTQILWIRNINGSFVLSFSQLFNEWHFAILVLLLLAGVFWVLWRPGMASITFLLLVQVIRFGVYLSHLSFQKHHGNLPATASQTMVIMVTIIFAVWMVLLPGLLALVGSKQKTG